MAAAACGGNMGRATSKNVICSETEVRCSKYWNLT